MKRSILIIAVMLGMMASHAQTSFTVTAQKVDIDAPSFIHPWSTISLNKAVKYRGDYYCYLHEKIRDPNLGYGCDHILCISSDGKKVQRVSKAETTRLGQYDEMVVRHDSLLIISNQPFDTPRYIETNYLHDLTQPSDGTIYEDEYFVVKYTYNGEWGRYLSFIERKNRKEHLYRTDATRILKRSDGYYLLSPYQLLRIADPREGKVQRIIHYRDLPSSKPEIVHDIAQGRNPRWGDKIDTTYQAMFLHKNQIHLLVSTSQDTYIGLFTGSDVVRQYSLGRPFGRMRPVALGQNQQDDAAFCIGLDKPILVDIHDDSIDVKEFDFHLPQPHYVGDTGFETTIRFLAEHSDNLRMPDVQMMEHEKGGISNNITNIDAWHNKPVINPKDRMVFYTIADSILTLETCYYYHHASQYVDQIDIHFISTHDLLTGNVLFRGHRSLNKDALRTKMIEVITKVLGKHPVNCTWNTSGMSILCHDDLGVTIKKMEKP